MPRNRISAFLNALRSQKGRDVWMFLLFLLVSIILWGVMSLNEEEQQDVRMPVRITHVPDSVVLLSSGPEALNVSLKAKGSMLLKMSAGATPPVNIDFREWRSGDQIYLNAGELKGVVRQSASGSQVGAIFPDSISIPFTTHAGVRVPVLADVRVSTGPRSALVGRPRLSTDSVLIYARGGNMPENSDYIRTEPLRLNGLDQAVSRRLKLLAPPGTRAVPDSVDVAFEVEPLIFKTRKVVIEPVNVPDGIKLITFPAQMDVLYMVPMSAYTHTDPRFRVVADYAGIRRDSRSAMIKLQLLDVPANLQNVHLSSDSAEYILERLR